MFDTLETELMLNLNFGLHSRVSRRPHPGALRSCGDHPRDRIGIGLLRSDRRGSERDPARIA